MKKFCLILTILMVLASECYAGQKVEVESMNEGISEAVVSVGVSAVALPTSALKGRKVIAIRNNEATTKTLYIGASDVSTTNGFPLDATCPAITLDLSDNVVIYGITGSSTVNCRVLEAK